jgi:hypothetical protein
MTFNLFNTSLKYDLVPWAYYIFFVFMFSCFITIKVLFWFYVMCLDLSLGLFFHCSFS